MKQFSMRSAKNSLRSTIEAIEPPAIDYIDWECFERELDDVMKKDRGKPTKQAVMKVFAEACTRARMTYHAAVKAGVHFNAGGSQH